MDFDKILLLKRFLLFAFSFLRNYLKRRIDNYFLACKLLCKYLFEIFKLSILMKTRVNRYFKINLAFFDQLMIT